MQAIVLENEQLVLKDIPKPYLDNRQGAIVKITGCGLCGSDIVKFKQHPKDGLVLGHEITGIIQEIDTSTNFAVGDNIVMGHHVPCFECTYCKNENYSMCRHFKDTNIVPGGFAEYIYITEEHLKNTVFKIPNNLSQIEASFLEPLACCLRAIRRAELRENSTVVIVGLGSIGLLMGQAAQAFGHKVIGCDLLLERLKIANDLGFDETIKSANIEQAEQCIKKHSDGYGADAVFMTAGAYQTIPLALSSVRDGGKIVVFSSVPSLNGYANNDIYYRELTILGSYSPAPIDLKTSLKLLSENKVMVKNFSAVYNLRDLQKAINDTISNKILKAYIKI